jgi:hypothetical protein
LGCKWGQIYIFFQFGSQENINLTPFTERVRGYLFFRMDINQANNVQSGHLNEWEYPLFVEKLGIIG